MTWTLTGFADEASPDFAEQMALLNSLGVRHLEFRSAWRTNILDLDEQQLTDAEAMLAAAGVTVSSIGSPIGKIKISRDLEPHLDRMRHAGRRLGTLNFSGLANSYGAAAIEKVAALGHHAVTTGVAGEFRCGACGQRTQRSVLPLLVD